MIGLFWAFLIGSVIFGRSSKTTTITKPPIKPKFKIPDNPRFKFHSTSDWGYMLNINGETIHRVICEHFDGPIPKGWIVHHIDGFKQNNDPDNLVPMPRHIHEELHKKHGPYLPFSKKEIKAQWNTF